jgi:hypothetical protein
VRRRTQLDESVTVRAAPTRTWASRTTTTPGQTWMQERRLLRLCTGTRMRTPTTDVDARGTCGTRTQTATTDTDAHGYCRTRTRVATTDAADATRATRSGMQGHGTQADAVLEADTASTALQVAAASAELQGDGTPGMIRESTAHRRRSDCGRRRRGWRQSRPSANGKHGSGTDAASTTASQMDGTLAHTALAGGAPPLPRTGAVVAVVSPAPLPPCRLYSRTLAPAADGPCSPRPTTPSGPW